MKRLLTVASVVALVGSSTLATATTASAAPATAPAAPAAAPSRPPTPTLNWAPCTRANLKKAGAECALLEVPLDHTKPRGTKIKIALSRIKAKKGVPYQGPMLVNPGGPGGSGLGLSRLGASVPKGAGDGYDWIGFDPRGVGASVPTLACSGDYFAYNRPDYRVPTAKELRSWLSKAKGYADGCLNSPGKILLEHVKTTDTVADMESIRKALGAKQINFYGFSYGTYLGQVYATRYPDRVRRMVLDSAVDPRNVWYAANLEQDVAFDKNFRAFFAWIAKNDDVYHLGTDPRAIDRRFAKTRERLVRHPAADGKIGPNEFVDAFIGTGYNVGAWPDAAAALSDAWTKNDWKGIVTAYDDQMPQGIENDNGFAMYLATQCSDVAWPASWRTWQRDNDRVARKSPYMTWSNAWYNAPCLFWHAKPAKRAPRVNGHQAPPMLLISETNDAATPYSGTLHVRSLFRRSVLVEGVGGTTHAASLSGTACVDDTVARYLRAGILPPRTKGQGHSDVKCPALAVPPAKKKAGDKAA